MTKFKTCQMCSGMGWWEDTAPGLGAIVRNMPENENRVGGLKPLELPEGLSWEMVRKAQVIIEDWEETPGVTDLDLIVRLYDLLMANRKRAR